MYYVPLFPPHEDPLMTRALIVEQNASQRTAWLQLLTHEGFDVEPADTYDQAHALVQDERFDQEGVP